MIELRMRALLGDEPEPLPLQVCSRLAAVLMASCNQDDTRCLGEVARISFAVSRCELRVGVVLLP